MAKDDAAAVAKPLSKAERNWASGLRERISGSLLPGETPLSDIELDEAAAFLVEAARQRADGKPAILTRSVAGERRFMRLAVINKDVPFLVDSIAATLSAHGLPIDILVHPVLPVRRKQGQLDQIPKDDGSGEKQESWVYIETARANAKERHRLEAELESAILDVRAVVADWPQMKDMIARDADRLADAEGGALLRWLGGGMMTQLGHLTRRRDGSQSDALGICRHSTPDLLADDAYDKAFDWFEGRQEKSGRAPLIVKANRLSKVHRRVPVDVFIVPLFENGRIEAISIHAGIWTSAALVAPPDSVPVLRQQLQTITNALDFAPGSHDYKSLVHALTALPHDLIISFSDQDIIRVATAMMGLADSPRPRATLVRAPLGRHVFAFVWLPRDMLSTAVRLQIQELLENRTGASTLDWSLMVEGGNLALLRYVLDYRSVQQEPDSAALDRALQAMMRGWVDAVEDALVAAGEDESRAAALAMHHAGRFPAFYRSSYGAGEAAVDIERLRHLDANADGSGRERDVRLYRSEKDADDDRLRLKVYQHRGSLPLSDAVPALENFGFKVLSEIPTPLEGEDDGTIHDFVLGLPAGLSPVPIMSRASAIESAICAVLNARGEDDVFNRLVLASELEAREADWLRAFYRYLRQSNIAFTIYTVVDALASSPAVTRGLIDLFRTRHDPEFKGDRGKAALMADEQIRLGLAEVTAINDDRLLRLYWETVRAILRTNAFAPAGEEALAFKLDSAMVPGLPRPVPWREIFVYSRRVEGIHLRAGPVARGGLRWSDRRDDFRTEILGLMKAQKVKNAVIVPTGAKGGFFPKRLPNPAVDRDAWFTEGKESYKLFICTLLSVTDNIVDDKVVHPEQVVVHDGEDPYFVVAADKGTATFSDTANAIAEEHGFWLGDAFASGGSNGYDHKAMGITARGAWLSVQRHFLERGIDVQTDPVRVIGCGDMSGDVFGNGMLLSKSLRLIAAYDHRHIFIDPDPDPAASWQERKRLFEMPRSSWADYSDKLLSKGGMIVPRTTKRIELTPEARDALGVEAESLDPDSLISAILKSPNDLLWFGGIGTYVKSSDETHAEVGDPANDALRVNGEDLRVKVVGEGANLGCTQAGRIEFALSGGAINTDFIDNSAGVDCSDNEVNIKIALAAARRAGRLSEERRNALLQEMTEDVAALVLEDNRLQALALSIAEAGGASSLESHIRLIETLEESGDLDRETEGLADGETLGRRAGDNRGLTRPELAVLLSTTKLVLQDAIEASDLAEDPLLEEPLREYFPAQMRDTFRKQIDTHRLRTELVATEVANRMVNRLGMVHPFQLAEEEGTDLAQVAAAFVAAGELFGLEALWIEIETAAMPEEARLLLFDRLAAGIGNLVSDVLRASGGRVRPSDLVGSLGEDVKGLSNATADLLSTETRDHSGRLQGTLKQSGAPEDLAAKVAHIFALDGSVGLSLLASDTGTDPVELASAFTLAGATLGVDWAQATAALMNPSDVWERLLVSGLARDFQQMRLDFLRRRIGRKRGKDGDPVTLVKDWMAKNDKAVERFRSMIRRAQAETPVGPAMLAQIASQARNLLAS